MADTRTDAEIVAALRRERGSAIAIDKLAWEIRHGDSCGRKEAERNLKDYATLREIAAVKRHLKS